MKNFVSIPALAGLALLLLFAGCSNSLNPDAESYETFSNGNPRSYSILGTWDAKSPMTGTIKLNNNNIEVDTRLSSFNGWTIDASEIGNVFSNVTPPSSSTTGTFSFKGVTVTLNNSEGTNSPVSSWNNDTWVCNDFDNNDTPIPGIRTRYKFRIIVNGSGDWTFDGNDNNYFRQNGTLTSVSIPQSLSSPPPATPATITVYSQTENITLVGGAVLSIGNSNSIFTKVLANSTYGRP